MSTVLVLRERLMKIYAAYSMPIEKGAQFLTGLILFALINANVGFMKAASSFLCTLGLAVICTFLPMSFMAAIAAVLIVVHFFALSLPIAAVSFVIFAMMYIFYLRFTPGKAWLMVLPAIAFGLKIPFIIPVAFGLLGTPVWCVPAAFGVIAYYVVHFVKTSSTALKGADAAGMLEGLSSFTRQVLMNKEMWLMVFAIVIGMLVVNVLRTRAINQSWKAASAIGAAVTVATVCVGAIVLGLHFSFMVPILSAILGIFLGFGLEIVFFSVDYSRTENMQFEDEEYYYYVKAVPKVGVPVPVKTVKHITERQSQDAEEEENEDKPSSRRRWASKEKPDRDEGEKTTDDILLTRTLSKELGLDSEEQGK